MWIDLINDEIDRLENCSKNYNVCSKLADLYIIRDHCQDKLMNAYWKYKKCETVECLEEFLKELSNMINAIRKEGHPEKTNALTNFLRTSNKVDLEIKK